MSYFSVKPLLMHSQYLPQFLALLVKILVSSNVPRKTRFTNISLGCLFLVCFDDSYNEELVHQCIVPKLIVVYTHKLEEFKLVKYLQMFLERLGLLI